MSSGVCAQQDLPGEDWGPECEERDMWGTGGLAELSWVSEPLPHAKSPLRFRLGASYPEQKPLDQDFFHLDRLQTFFFVCFFANQEEILC